jgi:hypothetical protein
MKSRSKALAPREAVIAKIKAAIARGDREEAICLALDNGLRDEFVQGQFETWWPDGITQEPARGWSQRKAEPWPKESKP